MDKETISTNKVTRAALHSLKPGESMTFHLSQRDAIIAKVVISDYNRYYSVKYKGSNCGVLPDGSVKYVVTNLTNQTTEQ